MRSSSQGRSWSKGRSGERADQAPAANCPSPEGARATHGEEALSDSVLCAAGSTSRIVVDRGDRLHPDCHGPATAVSYRRPPTGPPTADASAAHAAQQAVSGDGSYSNPYTAECDDPRLVDCEITVFAARSLSGLWANEYVPAYKCPTSHPYLYDQSYAGAGTSFAARR
jgi:hypothetical protein